MLEELEQRQALGELEGLQCRAQRGLLLIERGDRGGEIQALHTRTAFSRGCAACCAISTAIRSMWKVGLCTRTAMPRAFAWNV